MSCYENRKCFQHLPFILFFSPRFWKFFKTFLRIWKFEVQKLKKKKRRKIWKSENSQQSHTHEPCLRSLLENISFVNFFHMINVLICGWLKASTNAYTCAERHTRAKTKRKKETKKQHTHTDTLSLTFTDTLVFKCVDLFYCKFRNVKNDKHILVLYISNFLD